MHIVHLYKYEAVKSQETGWGSDLAKPALTKQSERGHPHLKKDQV
jgi:hypothetical protein